MIAIPNGPFGSRPTPGKKSRKKSGNSTKPRKTDTPREKSSVRERVARAHAHFDSIEHLSAEAVAGYVDNELPPIAMNRARSHLVHCAECRAEVIAQRRASERLRQSSAAEITAPSSLMAKLTSIAHSCPEGPEAEDLSMPREGDSIIAKVETFYRAVKKAQGR